MGETGRSDFKGQNIKELSPITLAYIGDAVYELYVRLYLVKRGRSKVKDLHREAASIVKASAQADNLRILVPILEEEELDIVRKGRNAKSHVPRNAEMIAYRLSTGFEALIGYLYLLDRKDRIMELLTYLLVEREKKNNSKLGSEE